MGYRNHLQYLGIGNYDSKVPRIFLEIFISQILISTDEEKENNNKTNTNNT